MQSHTEQLEEDLRKAQIKTMISQSKLICEQTKNRQNLTDEEKFAAENVAELEATLRLEAINKVSVQDIASRANLARAQADRLDVLKDIEQSVGSKLVNAQIDELKTMSVRAEWETELIRENTRLTKVHLLESQVRMVVLVLAAAYVFGISIGFLFFDL